jgi:DNA phosphorothioation-associated putative methyltransferase
MEHGIIVKGRTILDYGCGRGSDLQLLTALGYKASGFDPHFRPVPYSPADVVNLGYVLNVIEDRAQRRATLLDAWAHARLALVVGVYLGSQQGETALDDGYVTKAGTFQWWQAHASAATNRLR